MPGLGAIHWQPHRPAATSFDAAEVFSRMSWHANLKLQYTREDARTVVRHVHEGPLRVLQTLYPEGDAVAHNVLVHPPSGIVGGDTLDVRARVAAGAHAFVT